MPAEIAQVHLVPHNFCLYNPANDVPPSTQDFKQSNEYKTPEGSQYSGPSGRPGNCQSHL
ncbi:hypothetical protein BDV41DRAFT_536147 [Aspergillus transmontanensis]|uniref:Uncharacterized protein n=1 Tax=Aspergillus transmontanensis TaxID=1034304 RepID=A0A5N6VZQ6_9EURO|nr:hypothetical protein BDV41DRAFT_536147 [Aspergillus transmontanensis]